MEDTTPDPVDVVVAIATYRRPELLRSLLPEVVAQATGLLPRPARVVVVDNDAAGSAEPVVRALAAPAVDYVVEARPGIAAARNCALDHARGADALVFLDDDESPAPGWLDELVSSWNGWRCAAVAGPVLSTFETEVDPWVTHSPVFRRRRLATGTSMRGAATNNLLLDLRQLDQLGLRFDDRFGLTGGSDTLLTHDLVRRGGVIRWCDEAVMTEVVPASRATREWALRRSFRTGNGWSRVKIHLAGTSPSRLRVRIVLVTKALASLGRGVLHVAVARVSRDLPRRVAGEMRVATALGSLAGAAGGVHTEYKRAA